ncbi:MAG TPA: twin-arginine translocase TatA/TatE family subunit, partial [Gemmatimonadaceae bacterium]|nr:twin-arginine translocase TatA/TatE family subunit [Gemmatimonadaceae bacterium]
MNFGNMGIMEWTIVLVIVLVLFGARRVPEIGASIGKGIREFKKSMNDVRDQVTDAANDQPPERLGAGEPVAHRAKAEEEPAREPKR